MSGAYDALLARLRKAEAESDEAREQRDALAAWLDMMEDAITNALDKGRPSDLALLDARNGMHRRTTYEGDIYTHPGDVLADRIRRERAAAWDLCRQQASDEIAYIKNRIPRRERHRGKGDFLINARIAVDGMSNPYRDGGDDD